MAGFFNEMFDEGGVNTRRHYQWPRQKPRRRNYKPWHNKISVGSRSSGEGSFNDGLWLVCLPLANHANAVNRFT
jgi:hypothetical protein